MNSIFYPKCNQRTLWYKDYTKEAVDAYYNLSYMNRLLYPNILAAYKEGLLGHCLPIREFYIKIVVNQRERPIICLVRPSLPDWYGFVNQQVSQITHVSTVAVVDQHKQNLFMLGIQKVWETRETAVYYTEYTNSGQYLPSPSTVCPQVNTCAIGRAGINRAYLSTAIDALQLKLQTMFLADVDSQKCDLSRYQDIRWVERRVNKVICDPGFVHVYDGRCFKDILSQCGFVSPCEFVKRIARIFSSITGAIVSTITAVGCGIKRKILMGRFKAQFCAYKIGHWLYNTYHACLPCRTMCNPVTRVVKTIPVELPCYSSDSDSDYCSSSSSSSSSDDDDRSRVCFDQVRVRCPTDVCDNVGALRVSNVVKPGAVDFELLRREVFISKKAAVFDSDFTKFSLLGSTEVEVGDIVRTWIRKASKDPIQRTSSPTRRASNWLRRVGRRAKRSLSPSKDSNKSDPATVPDQFVRLDFVGFEGKPKTSNYRVALSYKLKRESVDYVGPEFVIPMAPETTWVIYIYENQLGSQNKWVYTGKKVLDHRRGTSKEKRQFMYSEEKLKEYIAGHKTELVDLLHARYIGFPPFLRVGPNGDEYFTFPMTRESVKKQDIPPVCLTEAWDYQTEFNQKVAAVHNVASTWKVYNSYVRIKAMRINKVLQSIAGENIPFVDGTLKEEFALVLANALHEEKLARAHPVRSEDECMMKPWSGQYTPTQEYNYPLHFEPNKKEDIPVASSSVVPVVQASSSVTVPSSQVVSEPASVAPKTVAPEPVLRDTVPQFDEDRWSTAVYDFKDDSGNVRKVKLFQEKSGNDIFVSFWDEAAQVWGDPVDAQLSQITNLPANFPFVEAATTLNTLLGAGMSRPKSRKSPKGHSKGKGKGKEKGKRRLMKPRSSKSPARVSDRLDIVQKEPDEVYPRITVREGVLFNHYFTEDGWSRQFYTLKYTSGETDRVVIHVGVSGGYVWVSTFNPKTGGFNDPFVVKKNMITDIPADLPFFKIDPNTFVHKTPGTYSRKDGFRLSDLYKSGNDLFVGDDGWSRKFYTLKRDSGETEPVLVNKQKSGDYVWVSSYSDKTGAFKDPFLVKRDMITGIPVNFSFIEAPHQDDELIGKPIGRPVMDEYLLRAYTDIDLQNVKAKEAAAVEADKEYRANLVGCPYCALGKKKRQQQLEAAGSEADHVGCDTCAKGRERLRLKREAEAKAKAEAEAKAKAESGAAKMGAKLTLRGLNTTTALSIRYILAQLISVAEQNMFGIGELDYRETIKKLREKMEALEACIRHDIMFKRVVRNECPDLTLKALLAGQIKPLYRETIKELDKVPLIGVSDEGIFFFTFNLGNQSLRPHYNLILCNPDPFLAALEKLVPPCTSCDLPPEEPFVPPPVARPPCENAWSKMNQDGPAFIHPDSLFGDDDLADPKSLSMAVMHGGVPVGDSIFAPDEDFVSSFDQEPVGSRIPGYANNADDQGEGDSNVSDSGSDSDSEYDTDDSYHKQEFIDDGPYPKYMPTSENLIGAREDLTRATAGANNIPESASESDSSEDSFTSEEDAESVPEISQAPSEPYKQGSFPLATSSSPSTLNNRESLKTATNGVNQPRPSSSIMDELLFEDDIAPVVHRPRHNRQFDHFHTRFEGVRRGWPVGEYRRHFPVGQGVIFVLPRSYEAEIRALDNRRFQKYLLNHAVLLPSNNLLALNRSTTLHSLGKRPISYNLKYKFSKKTQMPKLRINNNQKFSEIHNIGDDVHVVIV